MAEQFYTFVDANHLLIFARGGVPPEGAEVLDEATWTARLQATSFPAPATDPASLLAYASGVQDAALAKVWSFDVAATGATAHTVTTRLDQKGQFAMLKVQGWLTLHAGAAGALMPYSNVDFTATTLSAAEADSLVEQAAALDTKSYEILNAVSAGITASPPTVTTTAQIDAAFAALGAGG